MWLGGMGGGFGPFDQLFDQLIQFEQLNRHLYDSDLVGQTGKVEQKVSTFLKIHSYHGNYIISYII